jgi:hypothetical protein
LTSDSPVNFEAVPASQVIKSRVQAAETRVFAGATTAIFIYNAEVSAKADTTALSASTGVADS